MKNNIGLVIQARTGSKRLPGKVLKFLTKKYNVLEFLVARLKLSKNIKKIIIATSNLQRDDKILNIKGTKVNFFRGSENRGSFGFAHYFINIRVITSLIRGET